MLDALLRILGADLQARIAHVKGHVEALKNQAKHEVRQEISRAITAAGLVFAAVIMFAGSCFIVLMALYIWVDIQHGPFAALATVGALTTVGAAVLSALAMVRMRRPEAVPIPIAAAAHPAAAASRPESSAAASVPPAPAAPRFDAVADRITKRAASAADDAIDAASDLVGNGSRSAVVGTLAITALVGLLIGRLRNVDERRP
jgi:hypothetical protein